MFKNLENYFLEASKATVLPILNSDFKSARRKFDQNSRLIHDNNIMSIHNVKDEINLTFSVQNMGKGLLKPLCFETLCL